MKKGGCAMARPIKYDSSALPGADDRQPRTSNRAHIIVLLSFLVSLILIIASGLAAQETERAPKEKVHQSEDDSGDMNNHLLQNSDSGPLVVPVYPRGYKTEDAPISTDLRDNYIILEDGSALSVADWILGGLNKGDVGIGMTDYQNRLFLGQVARAAVGMDEDLVRHSYVNIRPTVTFRPPPKPGMAMQTLGAVAGLIQNAIFSGTPTGWHPAKTGGAFSPLVKTGGDAAHLFELQFHEAIMHTAGDLRESGTMQIMIKEAQDAQASDSSSKP